MNKPNMGAAAKASGRQKGRPGYLKFLALSLLLFAAGGAGYANAEVPLKVNFQGRLVESGTPVEGQRTFLFRIYDALTGGNLVWTSQSQNAAVTNGVFSVVLQTGTPVDLSTATFAGARYVSVSVGGVTLAPRQEMLSVPYALVAQALAPDALVNPASLSAGSLGPNVVASSIAVNAVSSTSLKDDAVTFPKIGRNGCMAGDIMRRNFGNTAWECAVASPGGSGGISLAPVIPDDNGTSFPSIYVAATAGADLLKLLQNGTEVFTVDNSGVLTAAGVNVPSLKLADNVVISSETSAALGAGVNISSNVYIVGFSSAAKYFGDGSGLTGIGAASGDNLGNHTATKNLDMAGFSIVNASSGTFAQALTAGYYEINGSTVVALLPGTGSLGVGVNAGRANTGNYNLFVGSAAGNANTTGSGNVFLGPRAGYAVTTGTGNIIIGYNQDASAPGANNEINIGGAYKGNVSSGTATIPKFTVRAVTGDTAAAFGETLAVNSAADVTVTLPAVTAADIGATITVMKLGAGKVSLAANGTPIADSAATGTIYNNAFSPPYASLTLRLADASRWGVVSGDGAWITTGP